jgi:cyclophilin family peptidyl-prolyl cis-trans isomerase
MRLIRPGIVVLSLVTASLLRAQSTVPALTQSLPAQTLAPGGAAATVDLRNYFGVPGVVGTQFAQFNTVFGRFNVELRGDVAPRHVANFLAYVQAGTYTNSFFHRSASFDNAAVSIVQGGGYAYRLPFEVYTVTKFAPVALEYNLPNARGTLAAARSSDINSATSEWYFNVRDNSTILNQSNGGGYTVFGAVLGTGMTVIDQIASVPRYNAGSPFNEVPLRNYTSGTPNETNLVVVTSVREATLLPTDSRPSVVEFTVQTSPSGVVNASITGSTLTLAPVTAGSATITVQAADANGNTATGTFAVSVTGAATKPVFASQPMSQTVAAGTTVAFNAPSANATSYRWERNGIAVGGATGATLVISNVTAANAGTYVAFATNALGTTVSEPAALTVATVAATDVGRLVNLSIRTSAGAGDKVLTVGAVIGPFGSDATLPLVIRAIGPTLAQFDVPGVLADPVMTFYKQGNATPIDSNDNWGGSAAMSAAFSAVGAFALPGNSADSAIVRNAPGVAPGDYTVQITGKGSAGGTVLAELYDAIGSARTAASPRLINLSTRAPIDAGSDLTVGFYIGGATARTVLVRGVGPSLAAFNVPGLMANPQLELFNDARQRILANDDWGGAAELSSTATAVGAFPLIGATSKDAVVVVTLAPGAYTARVSGVDNTGGTAIVEIYEVP